MSKHQTQLSLLQDDIRSRYDSLSKRLKQVAQYILDNSNSVAFDTVASIAQHADVPPSTLIRFANAFGFSGFNEMKSGISPAPDGGNCKLYRAGTSVQTEKCG